MRKRVKSLLIVGCVCVIMGSHTARAQSNLSQSKKSIVETPFTMILGRDQSSELTAGKSPNIANQQQRKTLRTMSGRRLKAGIRASEHFDNQGGHIVLAGLNSETDANADQIIYEIPTASKTATALLEKLETRYGQPDEAKGNERIWHIQNPDMRNGQAKIITLRVSETGGKLRIDADRTPITRRGELLVKPQRQISVRGQTSGDSNQTSSKPVQQRPLEVSND